MGEQVKRQVGGGVAGPMDLYSLRDHQKAFAFYLEIFEADLGFKRIVFLLRVKGWSIDRRQISQAKGKERLLI